MSNRKLTASDWETIDTLFERGEKNVRDLAIQFGVSHQAISNGIKDRGITKGSHARRSASAPQATLPALSKVQPSVRRSIASLRSGKHTAHVFKAARNGRSSVEDLLVIWQDMVRRFQQAASGNMERFK